MSIQQLVHNETCERANQQVPISLRVANLGNIVQTPIDLAHAIMRRKHQAGDVMDLIFVGAKFAEPFSSARVLPGNDR